MAGRSTAFNIEGGKVIIVVRPGHRLRKKHG
jgi:hypothetical protein